LIGDAGAFASDAPWPSALRLGRSLPRSSLKRDVVDAKLLARRCIFVQRDSPMEYELLNAYLLCDANLDLLRGIASTPRRAIGDRIDDVVERFAWKPMTLAANLSAKPATKQTKTLAM
jgi:hypothetical protein